MTMPSEFPSLARRWAEAFSEHLSSLAALREALRRGAGRVALRRAVTDEAVALVGMMDHLTAYGLLAGQGLTGIDERIWTQTLRYADAVRWLVPPAGVPAAELLTDLAAMQAAWERFERFVQDLPEDFPAQSAVLAARADLGERLAEVFGPRVAPSTIVG
jgi:hypothetical protein